jgi:hypothetical protein
MIRGADDKGECISSVSDLSDNGDIILNFGEDLIYECS